MAGDGQGDASGIDGRPTRSRQAILGRVNGVTRALAREVGNEKVGTGFPFTLISVDAQQEVTGTEDIADVFADFDVGAAPVC